MNDADRIPPPAGWLHRVQSTLAHLDNARHELNAACADLSSIHGLAGQWLKLGALSDRVRAFGECLDAIAHRRAHEFDKLNAGNIGLASAHDCDSPPRPRTELEETLARR